MSEKLRALTFEKPDRIVYCICETGEKLLFVYELSAEAHEVVVHEDAKVVLQHLIERKTESRRHIASKLFSLELQRRGHHENVGAIFDEQDIHGFNLK